MLEKNDDDSISMWNINYGKDHSPSALERHLERYHWDISNVKKQKIAEAQVTQKKLQFIVQGRNMKILIKSLYFNGLSCA